MAKNDHLVQDKNEKEATCSGAPSGISGRRNPYRTYNYIALRCWPDAQERLCHSRQYRDECPSNGVPSAMPNAESQDADSHRRAEMLHNDAGQMAKNDLVAQGNADMTVHAAALRAQQTMQNLTAQTPILELATMLQIYACRIAKKDLMVQDKAGMTLRTTALQAQQGCRISRREGHTRNNQDVARICWPDGPKRPCCPRHPRHEWRCDIA